MHNYESTYGRLPPAVVYGADGQPLHSWRVLILPFIEQETLLKEFRLDEPWDSPHNLCLLPRMPKIYAVPAGKASKVPAHHTICHVFVGKGTPFEGPEGLPFRLAFPDGSSNTLLLVEAGAPVPWTKPEELCYDPDRPLPALRGIFSDGFRVRCGDGSARFIHYDTSEATLRALITSNGKDIPGPD